MPYKEREERIQYLRKYRKINAKRLREHDRRRWPLRKDKRTRLFGQALRDYQRQYTYNMSPEEFKARIKKQKNRCAICLRKERHTNYQTKKRQSLSVDHSHTTGKNRDLLCQDCNRGLGIFDDSAKLLIRAAQYLKRHKGVPNGR